MKVVTDFIPETREWRAIDDSTYEGSEADPVGYGKSEQAAIEDLQEKLLDREDRKRARMHKELLLLRLKNALDIAQLKHSERFEYGDKYQDQDGQGALDGTRTLIAAPPAFIIGYLRSALEAFEHEVRKEAA